MIFLLVHLFLVMYMQVICTNSGSSEVTSGGDNAVILFVSETDVFVIREENTLR